jgi:hypothetical protein
MTALRPPDRELVELVGALAPYWGGEAEVVATYFRSSERSPETDRQWLGRQCHKELVDGVDVRLGILQATLAGTTGAEVEASAGATADADRHRLLRWAVEATEELHHYCLFADVYDSLGGDGDPPLAPATVRAEYGWPANDELRAIRTAHRAEHGSLGWRALVVTEGGFGVLYAAGAALADGDAVDRRIAAACQHVLDDEFDHVLEGITGNDVGASDDGPLLRELCVAQSAARIRMRNEQFGFPIEAARLEELVTGGGDLIAFDWERAGFLPPHQPSATAAKNSAVASR